MKKISLFIIFCFSISFLFGEDLEDVKVNLYSPRYEDGTLNTTEGGVLESKDIRIQAKHIKYVQKEVDGKKEWYVHAHGDLLVNYSGKFFAGSSIEYNFDERRGIIEEGCTQIGSWYMGGGQILLNPDGTYKIYDSYITTCEGGKSLWYLRIKKGKIEDYNLLTAQNVQVRVSKIPIFWFPYLKAKLSTLRDIPAYYSFVTGGESGQRISMRYQIYSWRALKAYLQLDYWFPKRNIAGNKKWLVQGPSASLQFDYKAPNNPTTFQALNFLAYDAQKVSAREYEYFRRRFNGELNTTLFKRVKVNAQYERLSDDNVIETYFNSDYFLQTQLHTHLQMSMNENMWLSYLRAKVRINEFQSVNQELPAFFFNLRPFSIPKTPFITDFTLNVGYYDYVFGDIIRGQFPNFRSPRLEVMPKIYFPIRLAKGLTITPKAEYVGIGYGQSYVGHPVWNSLAILEANVNYKLSKIYKSNIRHTIEPYSTYKYYSRPSVPFQDHFFFNINDAYVKLNQLRYGLRNFLYYKSGKNIYQPLLLDVYAYSFFNQSAIGVVTPRIYAEINSRFSFIYAQIRTAWNLQHRQLDHFNFKTAFTLSETFSMSLIYMHRGPYDYRKADHDSFLLNVFRPQYQLVNSAVSDRRDILQTKIYWRALQDVIFEFESRAAWDRINIPSFSEFWFNTTILLPCNWRFTFSPQKTVKQGWRFNFHLQLGGKPPKEFQGGYVFW